MKPEDLVAAAAEGSLDEASRAEVNRLLREDPDARRLYLVHVQMHALLREAHGELQALRPPARPKPVFALAAAAALLVAGAALWVLRPGELPAELSLQGEAWVQRGDVRVQDRLRPGDRLLTGPRGSAELRTPDGARVLLHEDSDALVSRSRVDLASGSLRGDVAPRPDPIVFRTPQAEATILGTSFDLSTGGGETRLNLLTGLVRLSGGGASIQVATGQQATADASGLLRWIPVCAFDFAGMTRLPPGLEAVFCPSDLLHTPRRRIEPGEDRIRFVPEGLVVEAPGHANGLRVVRWTGEVGDDLLMEVDVAPGERWSLGFAVGGDSFNGVRVIFGVPGTPPGISIDTIHPVDWKVFAADPRPIPHEREHLLRVERRGDRIRVWVDRELRIDTRVAPDLPGDRKRSFAISNYGSAPVIRALRVWKPGR